MIALKPTSKESGDTSLIDEIIFGIEEVKGVEVSIMDLSKISNTVCKSFILCTGTSNTHVSAIAGSIIDETIKTLKDKPFNREGLENGEWILLDYGNVVVHVFQKETRDFYNIEKLWGDADIDHIKDIA